MPSLAVNLCVSSPLARKALPPAHWGYVATGVESEVTLRANREAFEHYQLRERTQTARGLSPFSASHTRTSKNSGYAESDALFR